LTPRKTGGSTPRVCNRKDEIPVITKTGKKGEKGKLACDRDIRREKKPSNLADQKKKEPRPPFLTFLQREGGERTSVPVGKGEVSALCLKKKKKGGAVSVEVKSKEGKGGRGGRPRFGGPGGSNLRRPRKKEKKK